MIRRETCWRWTMTCSAQANGRVNGFASSGWAVLPAAQWPTAPSNRLTSLAVGTTTHSCGFDDNGNLKQQDTDKAYIWDHADRLVGYRVQAGPQPSLDARY